MRRNASRVLSALDTRSLGARRRLQSALTILVAERRRQQPLPVSEQEERQVVDGILVAVQCAAVWDADLVLLADQSQQHL